MNSGFEKQRICQNFSVFIMDLGSGTEGGQKMGNYVPEAVGQLSRTQAL